MRARLLLCIVWLTALAPLGACASAPGALTVGQSTVMVNPPEDALRRYLLEVHEAIHRSQYRTQGVGRFLWDYLVHPSRRFSLEAEAYAGALCQLQALGGSEKRRAVTYSKAVKHLRGYVLVGHARHQVAMAYIDRVYREGRGCEALLARYTDLPMPSSRVVALLRSPIPLPDTIDVLPVASATTALAEEVTSRDSPYPAPSVAGASRGRRVVSVRDRESGRE